MIGGEIEPQTDTLVLSGQFTSHGSIRSNRAGLVNRFVDTGVKLRKGTKIAEVINPYGEVVETIEMPIDGYIWAWTVIGGGGDNPNWCVQAGSPIAYLFSEQ
jgi:predicted deacylase